MKHHTLFSTFMAFCLLVNVSLFANRLWSYYTNISNDRHQRYSYAGDDYPEHLPYDRSVRSSVSMTIQIDPHSFPISGPGATEKWESIYPPGYGFVRLGDSARLLCVAMFHQLHCIEKMRIFLDNPNDTHVGFPHQQHCMNYLRQSFLCKTDLTLEPLDMDALDINTIYADDLDISSRSGSGVAHICGDWETTYEVVGDNYKQWKSSWNISSPWDDPDANVDTHSGSNHTY